MSSSDDENVPELTMKKVFPIAQIQSKSVVSADLKALNKNLKNIMDNYPKLPLEKIWYAYERSGYNPNGVIDYIKSGKSLDPLPFRLSEKIWNSWSSARQDSLRVMFSNPNAFFYRNRPPGEAPIHGSWNEDEEARFHDRIVLFRKLGLSDQCWGLFSVPFVGRVGYQCSNFFRQQYVPDRFANRPPLSIDSKFKNNPVETLKEQAYDYTMTVMTKSNVNTVKMLDPISVQDGTTIKPKIPRPKTEEQEKNKVEEEESTVSMVKRIRSLKSENKPLLPASKEKIKKKIKKLVRKKDNSTDNTEETQKDEIEPIVALPEPAKEIKKKMKNSNLAISINLAIGARDVVTGKPMKNPMTNRDGYVLDKDTWFKVMSGEERCPFPVSYVCQEELIEINEKNFDLLKPYLVNVYF